LDEHAPSGDARSRKWKGSEAVLDLGGIAVFGPGSEWLWTMGQFLVLLITGLAIYRQLRAQGSANALSSQTALLAEWESEDMVRLRLAALLHIAAGKPGQPPTFGLVGNFFANVAALKSHGHLRASDSWEVWSGQVQYWWALAAPWLAAIRRGNPGIWGEFEELAAAMAALDRKNRVPNYVPADLGARTHREIGRLIERLRIKQEAKRGFVPEWPVASPASTEGPAIREASARGSP
jgi:hypothetical protein